MIIKLLTLLDLKSFTKYRFKKNLSYEYQLLKEIWALFESIARWISYCGENLLNFERFSAS